jgi:hypothetical protein
VNAVGTRTIWRRWLPFADYRRMDCTLARVEAAASNDYPLF